MLINVVPALPQYSLVYSFPKGVLKLAICGLNIDPQMVAKYTYSVEHHTSNIIISVDTYYRTAGG